MTFCGGNTEKYENRIAVLGAEREYPAGAEMVNAAYADGGAVDSCYWCPTCQEYMRRNFRYGDETGYGEIYDNDREGWEAINAELRT